MDAATKPGDSVELKDQVVPGGDIAGASALLAKMTREFADSLDLERALEHAIAMIAAHVGAEVGSLWLVDEGEGDLVCRASVGKNPITGLRLPISQGIVGRTVRENVCQTVLDVSEDPNFSRAMDRKTGFVTHSILCAPMTFEDKPIGAIQLVNKTGSSAHFAPGDIFPLQILASSAALAVTNARMAASLLEHERVRRELELAAEIQRGLLPKPAPPPYPIYGVNIPAREVSGDFYDILPLDDGRIAFCLGDVSGKGMNAALLMAKTASLYRCLARSIDRPGRLLGTLNDEIAETATRGMFVTMTAGTLDPKTGLLCLASAGHEPAILHAADGRFDSIPTEAPPLGIAPGIVEGGEFPESDLRLAGGSLYIFSDGLTEAIDPSGEAVGPEGLMRLVERFADTPLDERVAAIVGEVERMDTHDDMTLLAVSGGPAAA